MAAYISKAQPRTMASSPKATPNPYHSRQNRASLGELPRRKKNELSPVVEKRTWKGLTSKPLVADCFEFPGEDCPGIDPLFEDVVVGRSS